MDLYLGGPGLEENRGAESVVGFERGKISQKKPGEAGAVYKVVSATRDGMESRWMESLNAYVKEYSGDPPMVDKYEYAVGDLVYYFMFPDGRGMIVGKVRK